MNTNEIKPTTMDKSRIHGERKRIMNHLYRARELVGERVPWVKVRIVNFDGKALGCAGVGIDNGFGVMVDEECMNWSENEMKYIIFHELCHKYLGFRGHTKRKNHLMNASVNNISDEMIEKDFKEIAIKAKRC